MTTQASHLDQSHSKTLGFPSKVFGTTTKQINENNLNNNNNSLSNTKEPSEALYTVSKNHNDKNKLS